MNFGQAIQSVFRNYAEFNGVARRSEFWWWILFVALVNTALNAIPLWMVRFPDGSVTFGPTLSGLWSLAVLLPTLAVTVRRLRDAGYGWGHIFWFLVPVAGLIILAVLCAQPPRPGTLSQPYVPAAEKGRRSVP